MHIDVEQLLKITESDSQKGWSIFDDHMAMQNEHAYYAIYDMLSDIRPDTIIEIGTAQCGLTRFLRRSCNSLSLKSKIISYDISEGPRKKDSISDSIDYRLENCFNIDQKPENIPNQNKLFEFIHQSKRCAVFCDGGSKVHEFNVIAPHVSPGDIILAHDYAHSKETYLNDIKGKLWNWNEITYKDIEKTIQNNNLTYYNKELFLKAVWGCFIKE